SLHSFFSNDPPPTEPYPLSLHDALPIFGRRGPPVVPLELQPRGDRVSCPVRQTGLELPQRVRLRQRAVHRGGRDRPGRRGHDLRSEEHTSELQSQSNLVCRLLLEKKKKT